MDFHCDNLVDWVHVILHPLYALAPHKKHVYLVWYPVCHYPGILYWRSVCFSCHVYFNTFRPEQNRCCFPDSVYFQLEFFKLKYFNFVRNFTNSLFRFGNTSVFFYVQFSAMHITSHYIESFFCELWGHMALTHWGRDKMAAISQTTFWKRIFLNENVWILIKIALKFVPRGPINNISSLVEIMAWHRPGDKPLSESMMVSLLMHICVTQPQWVNNGQWVNDVSTTNFKYWSFSNLHNDNLRFSEQILE